MFPFLTTYWWKYFKWWFKPSKGFSLKFDQMNSLLRIKPETSWRLPDEVLCPLKQTSNHLWSFQEVFGNCNKCLTLAFIFLHNSCLPHLSESYPFIHFYPYIVQRCNFLSALLGERFVQIDFFSFCICVQVVISKSWWENLPESLF